MPFKYKIRIAYEGTRWGGWQVQHNAPSIQATLESVLHTVLQVPVALHGSGRTDAGVHALGQVAHFTVPSEIKRDKTFASLNKLLPPDIRVLSLEEAPIEFHARYSATSKIYHYHLHLDPVMNPLKRWYAYHVPHPVSVPLLTQAARHFVGTHDFSAFANEAHRGSAARDATRTLFRLDVIEESSGVRLEFEGDGFLYKMVRNLAGTLLDVCAGRIAESDLPAILAAKDRKRAGKTAPPHGLFLISVAYQ
jgi:tRNA pseudouridine38-40 synthase